MKRLDESLSLNTVATHFFMPKYHFSQIFKEETSRSVYASIKRYKINQGATGMKLNPTEAIIGIGLDHGYSASNYSSVFKQHRDTPSSMFRRSVPARSMSLPFFPERTVHFKAAEEYAVRIEVRKQEDLLVLYGHLIGTYADLKKNWYRFLSKYKDFLDEETLLVERFFSDPAIISPLQCICDICMIVEPDCGLNNVMRISGSQWITYHSDGRVKDIFETPEGIFSV